MQFVIILGAARSGTTMLANLLKKDARVIYVGEPKYVWKYKNFRVGHDMLTKEHITPEIREHIVNYFTDQFYKNNGEILLEKTPSNSLRFEFVYNIFPNAKYIHIIRNGVDVAFSAKKRWMGEYTETELAHKKNLKNISKATNKRLKRKWKSSEAHLIDILKDLKYSLPLFLNNNGFKKHSVWGPCYPDIYKDYKTLELIEVCSLQWKHSVESVLEFKDSQSFAGAYHEIRYEDIVAGDMQKVKEMFDFTGINFNRGAEQFVQLIEQNFQSKKHKSKSKETELILNHSSCTIKKLGYL